MKRFIITIVAFSFVAIMSSCSTSNTLSVNRSGVSKKYNKSAKKIYKKSPKVWCSQGAFNEW
ncbi:hypothetical protein ACFLQ5_00105 [Bacteroidota bacterium]